MKKFITAMSLLVGLGLATAQQTHPASATTTATAKTAKVEEHKMVTPAKSTKTLSEKKATVETAAKKNTMVSASNPSMKLKKDGTPDKRYKANQHLKKDGTPDKRYKTNK